mgnify:FL=1
MNAVEVNNYVIEEMGLAEENGEDVTIGYEDTYAIVYDIFNWLEENSLFIAGAETIWAFIITNLLIK